MIIRSLRWRLVLAMVLIIAAVAATSGLFSSVTVKRELDRFLIAQRRDDARAALQLFRTRRRRGRHAPGPRAVRLPQPRPEGDAWSRFYPPEMAEYRVRVLPGGGLELTRNGPHGLEALRIQGMSLDCAGAAAFISCRRATKDRAHSERCDSMSTAGSSPASARRRCWPSA
jgi:hypothetical protein